MNVATFLQVCASWQLDSAHVMQLFLIHTGMKAFAVFGITSLLLGLVQGHCTDDDINSFIETQLTDECGDAIPLVLGNPNPVGMNLTIACMDDCLGELIHWITANCEPMQNNSLVSLAYITCSMNGNMSCFLATPEVLNDTDIDQLFDTCFDDEDNLCSPACNDGFQQLADDIGCCFITVYGLEGPVEILLSSFCGLDIPGACESPFSNFDIEGGDIEFDCTDGGLGFFLFTLGFECFKNLQFLFERTDLLTENGTRLIENATTIVENACSDSCAGNYIRHIRNTCTGTNDNATDTVNGLSRFCSTNGIIRCIFATEELYEPTFNSTALNEAFTFCRAANESNICPEGCAEPLEQVIDQIGCCLNVILGSDGGSGDDEGPSVMEVLEGCGLQDPGVCPDPFPPEEDNGECSPSRDVTR